MINAWEHQKDHTYTFFADNLEHQNHKQNNHCKQTKRNSLELAESRRLFAVENKEKTGSRKVETKVPSEVRRRPIKITGTDIDGNNFELNDVKVRGEPISINLIQANLNKRQLCFNLKLYVKNVTYLCPHYMEF